MINLHEAFLMPISLNQDSVMQKPPRSDSPTLSRAGSQKNKPVAPVCGIHDFIAPDAGNGSAKGKIVDIECDGSKTLLEQQTAINYAEQTNNVQLVCYRKSAALRNAASVKRVPDGQTILPLLLIELPASTSVGSEVAAQLAAGRHLVFYTMVYVKGVETKVAGFR
jgi:hypothetical protein